MNKLPTLMQEVERYIPNLEQTTAAVSSSPVGWHLEHLLLVINQVVENIKQSDPANFKKKFSFWKTIIFITKKIPRGRVKAPAVVVPESASTETSIKDALHKAVSAIKELETLSANHYFKHPIFGYLNVKTTFQFLAIHTHHHLAIVKDIIKNGQQA